MCSEGNFITWNKIRPVMAGHQDETDMNKFVLRQSLLLFLTAVIWGVAFVAQSAGMEYVGPFTYNGVRSILGGIALLPCIAVLSGKQRPERVSDRTLSGGLCCGLLLFAASTFQQLGIQYTAVGKAGFITAMYILIVPLLGLAVHKKVGLKVWIGVGFGVCGLYLLCMQGGFGFAKGDALELICAVLFSFHILVIDYFSPRADGVKMSCIQFWVCGVLSLIGAFVFETPEIHSILRAWKPIGYGGIMSCGVAYTLQIIGQRDMNPTVASLILSLESVVSVIAGFLILHQAMSVRELGGCFMMIVAIVLAQLPGKRLAGRSNSAILK